MWDLALVTGNNNLVSIFPDSREEAAPVYSIGPQQAVILTQFPVSISSLATITVTWVDKLGVAAGWFQFLRIAGAADSIQRKFPKIDLTTRPHRRPFFVLQILKIDMFYH